MFHDDLLSVLTYYYRLACDGQLDVVFLIDSSGSIHEDRYAIVLDFIANITNALETRPGRTHIGALTFSDNAFMDMPIGEFQQKEDVLYALKSMSYRRGRTNTAAALRMMYNEMFTAVNGDRDAAPNVAFVVTDGLSTVNPENTIPEAIRARIAGVHVIVASVENDANK
jgi:collagen type VI alpha